MELEESVLIVLDMMPAVVLGIALRIVFGVVLDVVLLVVVVASVLLLVFEVEVKVWAGSSSVLLVGFILGLFRLVSHVALDAA